MRLSFFRLSPISHRHCCCYSPRICIWYLAPTNRKWMVHKILSGPRPSVQNRPQNMHNGCTDSLCVVRERECSSQSQKTIKRHKIFIEFVIREKFLGLETGLGEMGGWWCLDIIKCGTKLRDGPGQKVFQGRCSVLARFPVCSHAWRNLATMPQHSHLFDCHWCIHFKSD